SLEPCQDLRILGQLVVEGPQAIHHRRFLACAPDFSRHRIALTDYQDVIWPAFILHRRRQFCLTARGRSRHVSLDRFALAIAMGLWNAAYDQPFGCEEIGTAHLVDHGRKGRIGADSEGSILVAVGPKEVCDRSYYSLAKKGLRAEDDDRRGKIAPGIEPSQERQRIFDRHRLPLPLLGQIIRIRKPSRN